MYYIANIEYINRQNMATLTMSVTISRVYIIPDASKSKSDMVVM